MSAFGRHGLFAGAGRARRDPSLATLLAQAPTVGDDAPEQAAAAARARRRRAAAEGAPGRRNGTLLTGPAGVTTPATTQRTTLLGM